MTALQVYRGAFDPQELHVMPVDEDGAVLGEHSQTAGCKCKPTPNEEYPSLFIHHHPSGLNS